MNSLLTMPARSGEVSWAAACTGMLNEIVSAARNTQRVQIETVRRGECGDDTRSVPAKLTRRGAAPEAFPRRAWERGSVILMVISSLGSDLANRKFDRSGLRDSAGTDGNTQTSGSRYSQPCRARP